MHTQPTESHWQIGCNHAKGGIGPLRPYPNALPQQYAQRLANEGYMNGWRFGRKVAYEATANEGSEP